MFKDRRLTQRLEATSTAPGPSCTGSQAEHTQKESLPRR